MQLKRILTTIDFSEFSMEALDHAVQLAKGLGGEIYLLHVFEPPYFSAGADATGMHLDVLNWVDSLRQETSGRLTKLVGELQKQGVTVHPLFKEGIPYLEIINAAKEIPADLIVMNTHGRTGMSHLLMGSVAERVIQRAPCPVFTMKPKSFVQDQNGKG